jgi:tetratricopeptide (TPR) repeat protein
MINSAISDDAKTADYHLLRGKILAAMGKNGEAIKSCVTAIQLPPDSAEEYYALGLLYEKTGEKQKALKCHIKSLILEPPPKIFIEISGKLNMPEVKKMDKKTLTNMSYNLYNSVSSGDTSNVKRLLFDSSVVTDRAAGDDYVKGNDKIVRCAYEVKNNNASITFTNLKVAIKKIDVLEAKAYITGEASLKKQYSKPVIRKVNDIINFSRYEEGWKIENVYDKYADDDSL